jgi:hypothetical protein
MSVLQLPLLVDLQQQVGELVLSITSSTIFIILENALSKCIEKCGYGDFDHRYNVSPTHLLVLLAAENFTVVRVCADGLLSGPQLQEV